MISYETQLDALKMDSEEGGDDTSADGGDEDSDSDESDDLKEEEASE